MSKKDSIVTERMIELEIWLLENGPIGLNNDELLKLLISKNFSQNEIEYLMIAYYIPMMDIKEQLTIYDDTRPRMDELKFISDLQIKYNVDRNTVIKRIQSVRVISKYLRKNPNIKFPEIQTYNKLVRDRIPEIIESNGETPIYHILGEEEYWNYLLKKDSEELEEVRQASSKEEIKKELSDKLELIRAMAIYCGFTLEDIIEEADLKREKRGAFSKRLFLEKTYNYQKQK